MVIETLEFLKHICSVATLIKKIMLVRLLLKKMSKYFFREKNGNACSLAQETLILYRNKTVELRFTIMVRRGYPDGYTILITPRKRI